MNTIEISKRELAGLLSHASDDETRPHLCGVLVDVEAGFAFATDGHRLALLSRFPIDGETIAKIRARSGKGSVIDRASLTAALKITPGGGSVEIAIDGSSCVIKAKTAKGWIVGPDISARVLDVLFPPVEQVIPAFLAETWGEHKDGKDYGPRKSTRKVTNMLGVNAVYMAEACEYCAGQGKSDKGVTIHVPENELDPLVVRSGCRMKAVVVMPMRL